MNATEFYRKRLIELSSEGIMKRLNKIVNIDIQVQICEEYHQSKLKLLNIAVVVGTLVCDLCNGTGYICTDGSLAECYSCNGTGKAN